MATPGAASRLGHFDGDRREPCGRGFRGLSFLTPDPLEFAKMAL